jgi:hypothetical protein
VEGRIWVNLERREGEKERSFISFSFSFLGVIRLDPWVKAIATIPSNVTVELLIAGHRNLICLRLEFVGGHHNPSSYARDAYRSLVHGECD